MAMLLVGPIENLRRVGMGIAPPRMASRAAYAVVVRVPVPPCHALSSSLVKCGWFSAQFICALNAQHLPAGLRARLGHLVNEALQFLAFLAE